MKQKSSTFVSGLIMIVLGVLIAIFGVDAVVNTYFGIVALVSGVCLIALGAYNVSKKEPLPPATIILGAVLIAVSIALFVGYLSISILINLLVIIVLGSGAGLICYSVYLLTKKNNAAGIMNLVVGVVAVTLSILYITVPDFRKLFWIIVGVVIAVYGLIETIYGIKELKK